MQAGLQDHRTYMVPSVQRQRLAQQHSPITTTQSQSPFSFMHKKYHSPLGSLRLRQIFRRGLSTYTFGRFLCMIHFPTLGNDGREKSFSP
jgi:hypothetical protein